MLSKTSKSGTLAAVIRIGAAATDIIIEVSKNRSNFIGFEIPSNNWPTIKLPICTIMYIDNICPLFLLSDALFNQLSATRYIPENDNPVKTLIKNHKIGSGKRECISIVELAIAENAPKTLT